jgi:N-acetylglucosaminyldiphosphoundecaprenol N-acetyl-beta-D-mannosaminyltransferase
MINRGKQNVLGVCVDAVDYEAAVTRIIAAARDRRRMAVSALAVHGVMTGVLDSTQHYRLNHLDLAVPDGQPVRWAMNLLYHTELPDRVYGPMLTLKLCEQAARDGLPIYLYGSRPVVLEALVQNLRARFPGLLLAGSQPSRFRQISHEEKQAVVETIRRSGAAMVLVGLGCPRQEVWVHEYRQALKMPLIAVGAAFDFHAGILPQAPPWLQRLGLEWLYRLMREPTRLWKRYILLNPFYLALLTLQATGLKRFDTACGMPPAQEISYG